MSGLDGELARALWDMEMAEAKETRDVRNRQLKRLLSGRHPADSYVGPVTWNERLMLDCLSTCLQSPSAATALRLSESESFDEADAAKLKEVSRLALEALDLVDEVLADIQANESGWEDR